MTNSLVLVTNRENKTFGTGFIFRKERKYCYILTCSHVVEDTPKTLFVDSVEAKIVYQGSSNGLDLSILKAKIDREPLLLMQSDCNSFDTQGFKKTKNNNYILESIKCSIDAKREFRLQSKMLVRGWKLNINQNEGILTGYIGKSDEKLTSY